MCKVPGAIRAHALDRASENWRSMPVLSFDGGLLPSFPRPSFFEGRVHCMHLSAVLFCSFTVRPPSEKKHQIILKHTKLLSSASTPLQTCVFPFIWLIYPCRSISQVMSGKEHLCLAFPTDWRVWNCCQDCLRLKANLLALREFHTCLNLNFQGGCFEGGNWFGRKRPLAATRLEVCGAATCGHLLQLRTLAATCNHLQPIEWLQVAASGCEWLRVAACW